MEYQTIRLLLDEMDEISQKSFYKKLHRVRNGWIKRYSRGSKKSFKKVMLRLCLWNCGENMIKIASVWNEEFIFKSFLSVSDCCKIVFSAVFCCKTFFPL